MQLKFGKGNLKKIGKEKKTALPLVGTISEASVAADTSHILSKYDRKTIDKFCRENLDSYKAEVVERAAHEIAEALSKYENPEDVSAVGEKLKKYTETWVNRSRIIHIATMFQADEVVKAVEAISNATPERWDSESYKEKVVGGLCSLAFDKELDRAAVISTALAVYDFRETPEAAARITESLAELKHGNVEMLAKTFTDETVKSAIISDKSKQLTRIFSKYAKNGIDIVEVAHALQSREFESFADMLRKSDAALDIAAIEMHYDKSVMMIARICLEKQLDRQKIVEIAGAALMHKDEISKTAHAADKCFNKYRAGRFAVTAIFDEAAKLVKTGVSPTEAVEYSAKAWQNEDRYFGIEAERRYEELRGT